MAHAFVDDAGADQRNGARGLLGKALNSSLFGSG